MTDYEYIYKVAITLNNIGVFLIRHGRYPAAIETFKDAIRCTKESFFSNELCVDFPCTSTTEHQPTEYEPALHAAWNRKRIVQLEDCTTYLPVHRSSILVVTDQDDPSTVYNALEQNQSLFCCVTITPIEKLDIYDVDRLQLESALIVYNFGIAFRCLANRPNILPNSKGIDDDFYSTHHYALCASVRVMELTRCVTSNLLQILSSRRVPFVDVPSNLLLIKLLAVTNLHQLSRDNYALFENRQYYILELFDILATIEERETIFKAFGFRTAATAASA